MADIVKVIGQYISENDLTNVMKIISDPAFESDFKKDIWDLIPVLFKNISKEMINKNKELKICCEKVLETVAKIAQPEEAVLEFLDHLDGANIEAFSFILKLLIIALPRCTQNKLQFIESCLVSIRSFLEEFVVSDADIPSYEEYEKELYEQIPDIVFVFDSVVEFYSTLIALMEKNESDYGTYKILNVFTSRLLQLYDLFAPLGPEEELKPLHDVELKVLTLISKLVPNSYYFLESVLSRCLLSQNDTEKDNRKFTYEKEDLRNICDKFVLESSYETLSAYENPAIISNLAYGVFYHSVLCLNASSENVRIPVVYNPKYIFLSLASLTVSFFQKNNEKIIRKGLVFLERILKTLQPSQLERRDLYFQYHGNILSYLNNFMIYSQTEEVRKIAFFCFKKYFELFDYEAKYFLLINYRQSINHSGTVGFLITRIKDYVSYCLDNENNKFFKYYSGSFLYCLIEKYCFIRDIEKNDLVENADQIISSLNLIRFVLLRDKKNRTGIRNFMSKIEEKFLRPLKEGIKLSKEFYDLKLNETKMTNTSKDNNIELTINGQPFENLSRDQQLNTVFAALNAIDLIDSLLLRVFDCFYEI